LYMYDTNVASSSLLPCNNRVLYVTRATRGE
jgi:hypothetical protein